MREATRAAVRYAFDTLGLHRMQATHAPDNHKSRLLLEALGFEFIGILPQFQLSGGNWQDAALLTLINPSWKPPAPAAPGERL